MRWLLVVPRTVLTLIGGALATLIAGPLVVLIARFNPTSPVIDRIARVWSRWWLLLAGCHLEVTGRDDLDPTRSYVVVANHLSALDIMVSFLATPIPIRFLAKTELFRIPILASAMRAIGIVEVDRTARSAIHAMVNQQAEELVATGRSLIIYAEGTRSLDGTLMPFKKGAFTMAITGGLPVLPVTIHGTDKAWRPHTPWVFGGRVRAVVDEPIETSHLTTADVGDLRDRAWKVIAERFRELGGTVAG